MILDSLNYFIDIGNNYVCVFRPRHFGKTTVQNMIAAYYSKGCDSDRLFSMLKISAVSGYRKNLNRLNIIKIDLNGEYQPNTDKSKLISRLTREIKKEMAVEFPSVECCHIDLSGIILTIQQRYCNNRNVKVSSTATRL